MSEAGTDQGRKLRHVGGPEQVPELGEERGSAGELGRARSWGTTNSMVLIGPPRARCV